MQKSSQPATPGGTNAEVDSLAVTNKIPAKTRVSILAEGFEKQFHPITQANRRRVSLWTGLHRGNSDREKGLSVVVKHYHCVAKLLYIHVVVHYNAQNDCVCKCWRQT